MSRVGRRCSGGGVVVASADASICLLMGSRARLACRSISRRHSKPGTIVLNLCIASVAPSPTVLQSVSLPAPTTWGLWLSGRKASLPKVRFWRYAGSCAPTRHRQPRFASATSLRCHPRARPGDPLAEPAAYAVRRSHAVGRPHGQWVPGLNGSARDVSPCASPGWPGWAAGPRSRPPPPAEAAESTTCRRRDRAAPRSRSRR